jgi:hypothetical protein
MAMQLLVSFCNQQSLDGHPPPYALAELDTVTHRVTPIRLCAPRIGGCAGITGLAAYQDDLLAMLQGEHGALLRLSRQYDIKNVWPLQLVRDGHSLAVVEGMVYVASTGTDAIVEFDPNSNRERICWRASLEGRDSVHLNSLHWSGGTLYATAFGKRKGSLWRTADSGYVVNIGSGQTVAGPLYQPHSATTIRGNDHSALYFCESWRMAVGRDDGQKKFLAHGFTRGLLVTSTQLMVGISQGRARSRSSGAITANLDEPIWETSECSVIICQHLDGDLGHTEPIQTIGLGAYSREIYDLLPLTCCPA